MEKEFKQFLDSIAQILGEDERIKFDVSRSFKINREMICKK